MQKVILRYLPSIQSLRFKQYITKRGGAPEIENFVFLLTNKFLKAGLIVVFFQI